MTLEFQRKYAVSQPCCKPNYVEYLEHPERPWKLPRKSRTQQGIKA